MIYFNNSVAIHTCYTLFAMKSSPAILLLAFATGAVAVLGVNAALRKWERMKWLNALEDASRKVSQELKERNKP